MKLKILQLKDAKIWCAAIFALTGLSTFAQAPGGVSTNMTLWLKADNAATITGSPVQTWSTSGGTATGYNVTQATATSRPALVSGATNNSKYNYNPSIKFTSTSSTKLFKTGSTPDLLGTSGTAIIITTQSGITGFSYYSGTTGRYQLKPDFRFQTGLSSGSGYTFDWAAPTEYSTSSAAMIASYGCASTAALRKNSVQTNTPNNSAPLYLPSISTGLYFGGNNTSEYSNCSIAEVILFNAKPTLAEMDRIESYLAIKYGITRGGNTNTAAIYNYIAADGTTILWDKIANAGSNNDIAVIGRDDASGLNQKQSISVNNGEAVTISLGATAIPTENATNTNTFTTNSSFLAWANNGLTKVFSAATSKPSGILERLNRVWKTQATNFSQQTTFGFATSQITGLGTVGTLCLLFDDDGVDLSNATVVASCSGTNTGSRVEFTGIDIPAGKPYFTLARVITPTVIANNGPICVGSTLELTTETVGTTTTYSWTGPNGFTSTDQNPSILSATGAASGVYTVTASTYGCTATLSTTVAVQSTKTIPSFTQVTPICSGEPLPALPTTSNEGVTGTWSPVLDNTATATYTFTPSGTQCAVPTTMTITVNPIITPLFTQVPAICSGATLAALPITSNENITGTWTPALDNTNTTTYTFTPAGGQCASTTTMTVTVNQNVTSTFTQVDPICSGATLVLPTTSNEGVTGTWSPALNNTNTATYTFTPVSNPCAATATMTITVNPSTTPTFTQIEPICSGDSLSELPTTSNEGITGTWTPALDNTATTTYTFTPGAGPCATTITMTIAVNPDVTPTFTQVAPICPGEPLAALPTTSIEGVTGSWSPALDNKTTTTYTFTPDTNPCATATTMTVTVNSLCSIPKGISPGSGTGNSSFDLTTLNVKRLEIFNRYGYEVYSLDNYTNEWHGQTNNGSDLPDGTYFYQIHYTNNNQLSAGWVYILRKQ